jgi:hypothetical protein
VAQRPETRTMFASDDAENTIVHRGVQRLHLLAVGFA